MKSFFLVLAGVGVTGFMAFAQDDAAFVTWMKTIGSTGGSLRKNVMEKNGDAASADAKKLQEVFGQVQEYWSKKSADDAVKLAGTAKDAYGEVASATAAGKFEDAATALKTAGGTCTPCHQAHRERLPDGTSKIK